MSIIAKLRTWPESGGPLTHDEAREIIRGTADLHRAIREGQDAWHLLAARNEATIQGARQSERGLCDLKEVNLRIHSLLAAMGYEGSTEKMVDQLVSDAVARKAERDDARAKHAAALEGWEKNQLALARERAEFLAYWQRCKDELAKVQLHMSGRPIYDCIRISPRSPPAYRHHWTSTAKTGALKSPPCSLESSPIAPAAALWPARMNLRCSRGSASTVAWLEIT